MYFFMLQKTIWLKIACFNWILNNIFCTFVKNPKHKNVGFVYTERLSNRVIKWCDLRSIWQTTHGYLVSPASCLQAARVGVVVGTHSAWSGQLLRSGVTSWTMAGPGGWRTRSVGTANPSVWGSVRVAGPDQTSLPLNLHPSTVMKHLESLWLIPHCVYG